MDRTVTPEELKGLLSSSEQPTLLDVRRGADYDSAKTIIPGAQRQDPEKIAAWSQDLPKNKKVIVYCARGGSVSNSVIDHLHTQGLDAKFIEGGILAWKNSAGKTIPGPL